MKNSMFALLGAPCLAFAAPAYAQIEANGTSEDSPAADQAASDESGIYIALGGGLVLSERLRTNAGVSAKLDDGFLGLAAIGGRIGPLRGEIEGSYRRASVDSATGFGLRALGTGRVSALSGMGNLYLEPSLGLGAVRPYVGGGVGVSRFRARNVGAVGLPVSAVPLSLGTISGSKTVFAYQAMAGLSGPVANHVTASFGYRYFATPSADLSAPMVGSVRVRGLRSHGIEAGLRFGF